MFAIARDGVAAVRGFIAFGREKICLRLIRPAREMLLFAPVLAAHLLQTDYVRVELFHGVSDVVNLQASRRANAAHALVDIPGGDTQSRWKQVSGRHEANCGSKARLRT